MKRERIGAAIEFEMDLEFETRIVYLLADNKTVNLFIWLGHDLVITLLVSPAVNLFIWLGRDLVLT